MRLRKWLLGVMVLGIALVCITGCDDDSTSSDTKNPIVELTYPAHNAKFMKGDVITITAEATDNETVRKVEFYLHNLRVSTDEEAPYTYEFDTSAYSSEVEISVMAYDMSGNTSSTESITIAIIDMDFTYPLAIGNSWQYDTIYSRSFDDEAQSYGFIDDVTNGEGSFEIISQEVMFGDIEVFNFACTETQESAGPWNSNSYYNLEDSALICYGYQNASMIPPKNSEQKFFYNFDDKRFNSPREIVEYIERGMKETRNDSLYYDPVRCFDFPLQQDQSWIYRTSNNPWKIVKTVVGNEEVEVPAGTFDCWVVHITHPESDWSDQISFYEYVSCEGVIKRDLEFINSAISNEDGNVIGHYNSRNEQYLTDYEIVE